MPHFCRICALHRPNEAFSGRGHRNHICRKCATLPRAEREAIEHQDEIFKYLQQSHISEKNVSRLEDLVRSRDPRTAMLAEVVLEVARVKPFKRRRLGFLARHHPDLIRKLEETGLIVAHHW
jgi:hypothetical protein